MPAVTSGTEQVEPGAASARSWPPVHAWTPVTPVTAVPHSRPFPAVVGGPGPRLAVARSALVILTAIACAVAVQAAVVGGIQHRSAQVRSLATFRNALAKGEAPIGDADAHGHLLAMGTPMALLEIPSASVHEVVLQGTTSGVLMSGPGHRRGTPFPGQAGTSVALGRRAAYGGPFRRLSGVKVGANIRVTTGQGVSTYRVTSVRRAGDPAPLPLAEGTGRLQLVTATGPPFVPDGVVRVDADLTSHAFPPTPVGHGALPSAERPLANDKETTWALVLWLQLLIAVSVGAVWAWARWGRAQSWVVFAPPIVLASLAATGQFFRLLPNLL